LGNICLIASSAAEFTQSSRQKLPGKPLLPGEILCEVLFVISVLCLFLTSWYGSCVASGSITSLQDETMCAGTAK
jgi:hypothetical protein